MPSPAELLRLAVAALANARDLVVDAERLADAGSFPRAFALAALGFEETGKSQLCTLALAMHSSSYRFDSRDLWEQFANHKPRLRRVGGFYDLFLDTSSTVADLMATNPHESAALHNRRLRATYVDYGNGQLLTPSDVTEREARTLIERARVSISTVEVALAPAEAQDLLVAMADVDMTGVLAEIAETVGADPDTARARLSEFISGAAAAVAAAQGSAAGMLPGPEELPAALRDLLREIGVMPKSGEQPPDDGSQQGG
jgi:AbiV family abortive infection protein